MSSHTTQAWRYHKGGDLSQTLQSDKVELPDPGEGEILVDVEFVSLNPVDYKVAQHCENQVRDIIPNPEWRHFLQSSTAEVPLSLRAAASDFSGKVASLGPNTESKGLSIGDSVFGFFPADDAMKSGRGSLSKKVLVSAPYVEKIPPGYTLQQAAGFPVVGMTALELADHAKKEDRVLVAGGSTGVGLILTKMLKAKGCSLVVATGSGGKMDIIQSRGADKVVDYRAADFPKQLITDYSQQPFDVILDTVGDKKTHSGCGAYLKKGGHYYNIGVSVGDIGVIGFIKFIFSAYLLPTFLGGILAQFHMTGLNKTKMRRFAAFAGDIDLDPLQDCTFTFSEAPKAYQRLMEGRALGKIIVEVKE